jgi:phosphoenolpyruvate phosphomutase
MPDADLLTMTESLEAVRNMVTAVSIPVVADCNAGYGNAVNVLRMVKEFERAGVAGLSIEDYPFPKRCSLYENWDRELISIAEMAGKIRAAVSVRQDPDLVIIARIESLIAGEGIDTALARAVEYSAAGADALLIHGKSFSAVAEFCRQCAVNCPLMVVPTLFGDVPLNDLNDCGFRLAIFPNQAVRAATRAMYAALRRIRSNGTLQSVEDSIEPLSEIYRLVGLEDLREAEQNYVARHERVASAE